MRVRVSYSYDFPPAFLARVRECYGIALGDDMRARLKVLLHNVGLNGLIAHLEEYESIKVMDDDPQ